jgi:F420-dependent oxidoreductase-like protein
MRAPITLSLHLPNFNFPDTPPEALFEKLVAIANAAEDSGYSSITVMDHFHQIPGVGPAENYMLEGNTILGGLAARTSRVSVGLLVGGVMYRNPALLAKITTTLDIISGGRAILGLGAAWYEDEHKAYGFDFPPLRERFEHLEDALRIARAMFTQDRPTVEGRHHRIDAPYNNPRPIRGDIPIMVGGSGERKTLRLVAKYADACNLFGDAERLRHLLGVLERHCEDVGRDPGEITKTGMARIVMADTEDEARRRLDEITGGEGGAAYVAGTPERVAEQVQERLDAGIEGITISLPGSVHDLDAVRSVGETLGPLVGSPVA